MLILLRRFRNIIWRSLWWGLAILLNIGGFGYMLIYRLFGEVDLRQFLTSFIRTTGLLIYFTGDPGCLNNDLCDLFLLVVINHDCDIEGVFDKGGPIRVDFAEENGPIDETGAKFLVITTITHLHSRYFHVSQVLSKQSAGSINIEGKGGAFLQVGLLRDPPHLYFEPCWLGSYLY